MLSDGKALRMNRSVLELTDLLELDRHLQFSQNLCSFFFILSLSEGTVGVFESKYLCNYVDVDVSLISLFRRGIQQFCW